MDKKSNSTPRHVSYSNFTEVEYKCLSCFPRFSISAAPQACVLIQNIHN